MTSATEQFFAGLRQREREPMLGAVRGSIRFDVTGNRSKHWLVRIDDGALTVTEDTGDADCVLRAPAGQLEAIVSGRENTLAALLRGAVIADGELDLLIRFQRLFPGPPDGGADDA